MLEGIKAYIKIIAIFMIFISFAEILFPDSSLKKFINVFMGLLLMVVVLNSVNKLLNYDSNITINTGSFYNNDIKKFAFSKYSEKINEEVNDYLFNVSEGKAFAEVKTDESDITEIDIIFEEGYYNDEILNYISEIYNIENINVKNK